jgi:hypothetical protein
MHVGLDIKASHFSVEIDGAPASRDTLLDWGVNDRLGVVVDRPFGGLDATLMILLAGTAFYDSKKKRRMRRLYPDMFLFHAGGPWGSHNALDFMPDHKEIWIAEPKPQTLLRAINHVGITHLLIPDRRPRPVKHRFKEPEAALDRIKMVFTYAAGGSIAAANIRISTPSFGPIADTVTNVIHPEKFVHLIEQVVAGSIKAPKTAGLRATELDELEILLPSQTERLSEVAKDDPDRLRHERRLESAISTDNLVEEYGLVDIASALNMLNYP